MLKMRLFLLEQSKQKIEIATAKLVLNLSIMSLLNQYVELQQLNNRR